MFKGILTGVALTVAAGLAGAYLFVSLGLMPANADARSPRLERWAAHKSLKAALARRAPRGDEPLAVNDDNVLAGLRLYAANCAVCHGAADGKPSNIARGLYQHPPQFGRYNVSDDPAGETYWKIVHGIRLTGMPAYRETLADTQIWQLTAFLAHMDKLSPKADTAWKSIPSQAP